MADHTEFLEMAREMIAEDGRVVTFGKLSSTPADADKPWKGAGTPTIDASVTTMAVFLPDGSGMSAIIGDNELFKTSEQVLLVAPPVSEEALEDFHFLVDGADEEATPRWKINITKVLQPADLVVLYAMGVSR